MYVTKNNLNYKPSVSQLPQWIDSVFQHYFYFFLHYFFLACVVVRRYVNFLVLRLFFDLAVDPNLGG